MTPLNVYFLFFSTLVTLLQTLNFVNTSKGLQRWYSGNVHSTVKCYISLINGMLGTRLRGKINFYWICRISWRCFSRCRYKSYNSFFLPNEEIGFRKQHFFLLPVSVICIVIRILTKTQQVFDTYITIEKHVFCKSILERLYDFPLRRKGGKIL